MVTYLLHENMRPVLTTSLECLAQNRVQRLFETLVVDYTADVGTNNHL